MSSPKILGLRTLTAAGKRISVVFSENEGGSISARCVLGENDTPTMDGADQDELMKTLESALEGILLSRGIE